MIAATLVGTYVGFLLWTAQRLKRREDELFSAACYITAVVVAFAFLVTYGGFQ